MHSDQTPRTALQPVSDPRSYARERFSVAGARVVLDEQRGWQCTCATYAESSHCPHVEQAQAFRSMRGARREEDTIEMQLSDAQAQELARAAQPEAAPAAAAVVTRRKRVRRHSPWSTVAIAATLSAISSGITYVAATRAQANRAAEPQSYTAALAPSPAPHTALPGEVPVKFVNPFDATEIFEFPAGTSETGARDAVAELLLIRARDRLAAAEMRLRTREMAERQRVERAVSLAEAG
jgi:hypothetical protein